MTRRLVLSTADVARIRGDRRFLAAQRSRRPVHDWRLEGACSGVDPDVFFPLASADATGALSLCSGCAVVGPCLAAALDSGETEGVWGGTVPEERRAMRQVWRERPPLPEQAQAGLRQTSR